MTASLLLFFEIHFYLFLPAVISSYVRVCVCVTMTSVEFDIDHFYVTGRRTGALEGWKKMFSSLWSKKEDQPRLPDSERVSGSWDDEQRAIADLTHEMASMAHHFWNGDIEAAVTMVAGERTRPDKAPATRDVALDMLAYLIKVGNRAGQMMTTHQNTILEMLNALQRVAVDAQNVALARDLASLFSERSKEYDAFAQAPTTTARARVEKDELRKLSARAIAMSEYTTSWASIMLKNQREIDKQVAQASVGVGTKGDAVENKSPPESDNVRKAVLAKLRADNEPVLDKFDRRASTALVQAVMASFARQISLLKGVIQEYQQDVTGGKSSSAESLLNWVREKLGEANVFVEMRLVASRVTQIATLSGRLLFVSAQTDITRAREESFSERVASAIREIQQGGDDVDGDVSSLKNADLAVARASEVTMAVLVDLLNDFQRGINKTVQERGKFTLDNISDAINEGLLKPIRRAVDRLNNQFDIVNDQFNRAREAYQNVMKTGEEKVSSDDDVLYSLKRCNEMEQNATSGFVSVMQFGGEEVAPVLEIYSRALMRPFVHSMDVDEGQEAKESFIAELFEKSMPQRPFYKKRLQVKDFLKRFVDRQLNRQGASETRLDTAEYDSAGTMEQWQKIFAAKDVSNREQTEEMTLAVDVFLYLSEGMKKNKAMTSDVAAAHLLPLETAAIELNSRLMMADLIIESSYNNTGYIESALKPVLGRSVSFVSTAVRIVFFGMMNYSLVNYLVPLAKEITPIVIGQSIYNLSPSLVVETVKSLNVQGETVDILVSGMLMELANFIYQNSNADDEASWRLTLLTIRRVGMSLLSAMMSGWVLHTALNANSMFALTSSRLHFGAYATMSLLRTVGQGVLVFNDLGFMLKSVGALKKAWIWFFKNEKKLKEMDTEFLKNYKTMGLRLLGKGSPYSITSSTTVSSVIPSEASVGMSNIRRLLALENWTRPFPPILKTTILVAFSFSTSAWNVYKFLVWGRQTVEISKTLYGWDEKRPEFVQFNVEGPMFRPPVFVRDALSPVLEFFDDWMFAIGRYAYRYLLANTSSEIEEDGFPSMIGDDYKEWTSENFTEYFLQLHRRAHPGMSDENRKTLLEHVVPLRLFEGEGGSVSVPMDQVAAAVTERYSMNVDVLNLTRNNAVAEESAWIDWAFRASIRRGVVNLLKQMSKFKFDKNMTTDILTQRFDQHVGKQVEDLQKLLDMVIDLDLGRYGRGFSGRTQTRSIAVLELNKMNGNTLDALQFLHFSPAAGAYHVMRNSIAKAVEMATKSGQMSISMHQKMIRDLGRCFTIESDRILNEVGGINSTDVSRMMDPGHTTLMENIKQIGEAHTRLIRLEAELECTFKYTSKWVATSEVVSGNVAAFDGTRFYFNESGNIELLTFKEGIKSARQIFSGSEGDFNDFSVSRYIGSIGGLLDFKSVSPTGLLTGLYTNLRTLKDVLVGEEKIMQQVDYDEVMKYLDDSMGVDNGEYLQKLATSFFEGDVDSYKNLTRTEDLFRQVVQAAFVEHPLAVGLTTPSIMTRLPAMATVSPFAVSPLRFKTLFENVFVVYSKNTTEQARQEMAALAVLKNFAQNTEVFSYASGDPGFLTEARSGRVGFSDIVGKFNGPNNEFINKLKEAFFGMFNSPSEHCKFNYYPWSGPLSAAEIAKQIVDPSFVFDKGIVSGHFNETARLFENIQYPKIMRSLIDGDYWDLGESNQKAFDQTLEVMIPYYQKILTNMNQTKIRELLRTVGSVTDTKTVEYVAEHIANQEQFLKDATGRVQQFILVIAIDRLFGASGGLSTFASWATASLTGFAGSYLGQVSLKWIFWKTFAIAPRFVPNAITSSLVTYAEAGALVPYVAPIVASPVGGTLTFALVVGVSATTMYQYGYVPEFAQEGFKWVATQIDSLIRPDKYRTNYLKTDPIGDPIARLEAVSTRPRTRPVIPERPQKDRLPEQLQKEEKRERGGLYKKQKKADSTFEKDDFFERQRLEEFKERLSVACEDTRGGTRPRVSSEIPLPRMPPGVSTPEQMAVHLLDRPAMVEEWHRRRFEVSLDMAKSSLKTYELFKNFSRLDRLESELIDVNEPDETYSTQDWIRSIGTAEMKRQEENCRSFVDSVIYEEMEDCERNYLQHLAPGFSRELPFRNVGGEFRDLLALRSLEEYDQLVGDDDPVKLFRQVVLDDVRTDAERRRSLMIYIDQRRSMLDWWWSRRVLGSALLSSLEMMPMPLAVCEEACALLNRFDVVLDAASEAGTWLLQRLQRRPMTAREILQQCWATVRGTRKAVRADFQLTVLWGAMRERMLVSVPDPVMIGLPEATCDWRYQFDEATLLSALDDKHHPFASCLREALVDAYRHAKRRTPEEDASMAATVEDERHSAPHTPHANWRRRALRGEFLIVSVPLLAVEKLGRRARAEALMCGLMMQTDMRLRDEFTRYVKNCEEAATTMRTSWSRVLRHSTDERVHTSEYMRGFPTKFQT